MTIPLSNKLCRLGLLVVSLFSLFAVQTGRASVAAPEIVLYSQNFDAMPLGASFNETPLTLNVWARIPPAGWTFDNSGVPGNGNLLNDGVTEWAGWAMVKATWWSGLNQLSAPGNRGQFTNASGTLLVADGGRWSAMAHPAGLMTTTISTPSISVAGVGVGTLKINFDSSWQPSGQQTARILASFDGGPTTEVMRLESGVASPNFKAAAPNEHVIVSVNNPAGASHVVFTFVYQNAGNDFWWAIDNIKVTAQPKVVLITDLHKVVGPPAKLALNFTDTLPQTILNGVNSGQPSGTYTLQSQSLLSPGVWSDVPGVVITPTPPDPSGVYTATIPFPAENNNFYRILYFPGVLGDIDADGLSDSIETNGWNVTVNQGGVPSTYHVTSDPHLIDTDGDGLDDYTEFLLKTDPRNPDTDGDGLSDYDEHFIYLSNPLKDDTDGDGILDGAEVHLYYSSPVMQDTDGDNLRDDSEITDNPSNPDLTRPLISDLPTPLITLVSGSTVLTLDVTHTDSAGQDFSYSTTIGNTSSTALGQSDASSTETAVSASISASVGGEVGFPSGGKVTASVTATVGASLTQGQTSTVSTTQTLEANTNYTSEQAANLSHSDTIGGNSTISILFNIQNIGPRTFTISNIQILARLRDANNTVIGTLVPVTPGSYTLPAPGGTTATPIQAKLSNIAYQTMEKIFANPALLYFEVSYCDVTDSTGINTAYLTETNQRQTAGLTINYGEGTNGLGANLPPERYRVATEVFQGSGGVTISNVLNQFFTNSKHAGIPYKTAVQSGTGKRILTEVRGVAADTGLNGFWIVVTTNLFGTTGGAFGTSDNDFEQTRVIAGDDIKLIYVKDQDHDGLNDYEEFIYGSSDLVSDTDGDGISDYNEVKVGWTVHVDLRSPGSKNHVHKDYQVFSDPRFTDQDGDGLNDFQERTAGTDPRLKDTDGDGIPDNLDGSPLFYNPPAPGISLNTPITAPGGIVTISGTATSAVNVASVLINWGDGTTTTLTPPPSTTSFVFPGTNHTYAASATYTIKAIVTDADTFTATNTISQLVQIGPPRNGLLAEYLFSGNYNDTSGNGSNLVSSGVNITFVTGVSSADSVNQAVHFDNSGYIDGDASYLFAAKGWGGYGNGGAAYTVSCWAKWDGSSGGSFGVLVQQLNAPFLYNSGQKITFGTGGTTYVQDSVVLTTGVWHNYAVTATALSGGSRTFTFYRDGVQISQQTKTDSNTYTANSAAYIGGNSNGASTYDLVGTAVDQVRIYNRALSLTEIQAVANSSYP